MALVDRRIVTAALGIVALAIRLRAGGAPAGQAAVGVEPSAARGAEARAVAYLSIEVPRWRREHPCYSCHNNGDATRALIAASARGHAVGDAIDDTLAWLATPERWDSNTSARRLGGSAARPHPVCECARRDGGSGRARRTPSTGQPRCSSSISSDDGSWRLSESQILGGATFYGTSLGDGDGAPQPRPRDRRTRARARWRRPARGCEHSSRCPCSMPPSILLGLERDVDPAAVAQRREGPRRAEARPGPDGGWGPYVTSQSEPFDTALAVLALVGVRN